MLSFKPESGRFIAQIKGGRHDGEILHLSENNNNNNRRRKTYNNNDDTDDSEDEYEKKRKLKYVFLSRGTFVPLANQYTRECVYICGSSGSGKSTFAAEYIESYLRMYPENRFYAFCASEIKNDPAYQNLNPHQIKIDQNLIKNPINIQEEFTGGCIILFDDVTTIEDDKLNTAVQKLMKSIMELGRKINIYMVCTSHLIIGNEKKLSRTVLNEMTSLTVFPVTCSYQQASYALKTHMALDEKRIKKIMKTDSRWFTVYKTYPRLVLTEYECYII